MTPVTDLQIRDQDLVLSTQGLGFDIPSGPQGKNPPNGAVIYDTLAEELPEDQEMTLEILDAAGKLVRTF